MIKLFRLSVFSSLLVLAMAFSCNKKSSSPEPEPPVPEPPATSFVKGADVSWITEMEAAGRKFYNSSGVETELMALLKAGGMNTIRLRVWVNPANGYNNQADVVAKAVRAKALGLRVMIVFHHSDTWADPGKQGKPAAWASLDFAGLKSALANHTTAMLTALKDAGVSPEWVSVGNETNDGMLWPDGKASTSMAQFAQLVNAGYDASKAVFPDAKVIVHVSNAFNNSLFRWMFDGLKSNGAKWDIIGMSLYPSPTDWSTLATQSLANMNDMITRYGKEIMICEVGMSWDQAAASKAFVMDIISKVKSLPGNKGLGVLYWEPQSYGNWQGYTLGAFDNSGKPTIALDPFKD
ncbi:MAG: arabinogalactan endo-1,4-beta-galactosidase [Chitinophagaceae bacterium]|nr:MAG: arabinogalactan endo-1,4-beta-galactosidase [Chitinophagaceae bacterium]